jgi:hypothetical protein
VLAEKVEGCLAHSRHEAKPYPPGLATHPDPELHQISYLPAGKFDAVRMRAGGFKARAT